MPFGHNIIVAEHDETPFLAFHGMINCEGLLAAIAKVREVERRETKTEPYTISEFVHLGDWA